MYNEDFLEEILQTYSVEQAIIYCKIESDKYNKQFNEMKAGDPITHQELQYERDWWAERANSLKNNKL